MNNIEQKQLDLYVFDFDYTIVKKNSNKMFYSLFEDGKPPVQVSQQQVKGQWTQFMNIVLCHLRNKMNIPSNIIKQEVEKSVLTEGIKELFQIIKNKGGEIIVCSDGNSKFIEWIAEKNDIAKYFSAVYTNPCTIENDQIIIKHFYDSHDCKNCIDTPKMCKNRLISDHIALHPENKYNNIHYFGDGSNDFCPILSLKDINSTGNVRKGFLLEKKIESYLKKDAHEPFKCTLRYWDQATDLHEFF